MKRGPRILLLLLACGMVIAVVWPREREPKYHGKKLSEWLRICHQGRGRSFIIDPVDENIPTVAEENAARKAVRKIGTNGVPWALKWIAYERSRFSYESESVLLRLPDWTGRRWILKWLSLRDRKGEAEAAVEEFLTLGPEARGAIPNLLALMCDPRAHHGAGRAVNALAAIGKDAVPELLPLLNNRFDPNHEGCVRCICMMRDIGTNEDRVIPGLIRCLDEHGTFVAGSAVFGLSRFTNRPDEVVPALMRSLRSPDWNVRATAAQQLREFGPDARIASGALVMLFNDTNKWVRSSASNTLCQIAPEMLEDGHLNKGTNVENEAGTNVEHRTVNIER